MVRNCAELGANLQKIINRLISNKDLLKLLYYNDKDPLSQPDLTEKQIKEEVLEKLIKIIPRIGPKETANSIVSIRVVSARRNLENNEFRDITIAVEIFVPLTQWIIKDSNLRPFAIMGEIQKSLDNKKINGLGRMIGGEFNLNFLTEEISAYEQSYRIITYD